MDLFVARQPIFDLQGNVTAYELLYRQGAGSVAADGTSTRQMSLDVVIQSFLEIGLDRITRGKTAFINFSREMLLSGAYDLLDPQAVVIELLEEIEAGEEVLQACERLVGLGYTLALDDYVADEAHEPLLRFARIIKVDVLNRPMEEIRAVSEPLRTRKLQLLAERVETAEVRDHCKALGFELFQGYFFSRPEVISRKGASVENAAILQLMNLLRDDNAPDSQIEDAFRRDPTLSYKLLRMVNAAAQGGRGVESILHAVRLLGRATLHRWLALLLASSFAAKGGVDGELVQNAVLRARLCETLALSSRRRQESGALFMVGLFSVMDVLMGTSMEDILGKVDLAPDVKQALLHRSGPYAGWVDLIQAYEAGEWDEAARHAGALGVPALEIPELYLQSLGWVREQMAG